MQQVQPTSFVDAESQRVDADRARASRLRYGFLAAGLLVILAGTVAVAVLRGASRPGSAGPPLPKVAAVPGFSLTERTGRGVTLEDLRGHVWIADFIFTTCAGPCPELSLRMRSLQKDVARYGGDVKLVSFSVDPTYDQPPVLSAYAKRYGADPSLWWFLTCDDEPAMHELITAGFLQGLSPAKGGAPIIHSTRFVLVDRQGYIRAWYDGLEASSKPRILRDVERLLSEPAG